MLNLGGNVAPTWTDSDPIDLDVTVLDEDSDLVISLSGLFSDADIPGNEVATDFIAKLSTSSSNANLRPSYISEFELNGFYLDASENAKFVFSFSDGASVGANSIYLHLSDSWGETIVKTVILTVQGCDASCSSDTDCTTLDNTGCSSCAGGYSQYYDSDGSFCQSTCPAGQYGDRDACQACNDLCASCSGDGFTLVTEECQECADGKFIMPLSEDTCVESCDSGYTYEDGSNLCYGNTYSCYNNSL